MDASLESLLICPVCRRPLRWSANSATCTHCALTYSIDDGVLNVVARPSRVKRRPAAARLLDDGRLYDVVQCVLGYRVSARRLQAALGDTSDRLVLDVGGGTGNLIPYLSPGTRYVCLDNDAGRIRRLRESKREASAVVGDATQLPFRDKCVDIAVCVAVTHHLADEALTRLVDELARVSRERVVVFDPLRERSWRSRLLWRIDRGSFPRTEQELAGFLTKSLTPERVERFAIHHHYLLWVGRPSVIPKSSGADPVVG